MSFAVNFCCVTQLKGACFWQLVLENSKPEAKMPYYISMQTAIWKDLHFQEIVSMSRMIGKKS